LYINDITEVSVNGAKFFLYADDTGVIVTNSEYDDYKLALNKIFCEVNTWFRINLLKLNVNKTHILQFITQSTMMIMICITLGINYPPILNVSNS
jgi:hypothetical protein